MMRNGCTIQYICISIFSAFILHSSSKETQVIEGCISLGEECILVNLTLRIDMILGQTQWPRDSRKNGWIKPAFLLVKSVYICHIFSIFHRYNARDGKWLQISSMNVPRTYFSLVALDDCLLAVGGKHNRVAVSSAEKYMFGSNEWTSVASLPNTLFSHAGEIWAK